MDAKVLLAMVRRNREVKVDLGDGLSVTFLRPTEGQVVRMTEPSKDDPDKATIKVEDADVRDSVTAWEGFTEATILGAAVGSADPVAFDRDLWGELAADHRDWYFKVAIAMLDAITAHNKSRVDVAKN